MQREQKLAQRGVRSPCFLFVPVYRGRKNPDKKKTGNLFKEKERRGCMEEERRKGAQTLGARRLLYQNFEKVCV